MKKFNTKEFLSGLKKNDFVKACALPIGYKAGFPMTKSIDGRVLLSVPYRKYKYTNKSDKLAVMPIEYVITFELKAPAKVPESIKEKIDESKLGIAVKPAGFEVTKNNETFAGLSFDKPVGVFPEHNAEKLGVDEYKKKVEEIYSAYDVVINDMLGIEKASGVALLEFEDLLSQVIEPCLKPMYQKLNKEFAEKYLA